MATPLSSTTAAKQAMKEEDEGHISIAPSAQVHSDHFMDILRCEVQRRKLEIKNRRASASAQPAPPPPVQHPPPPPPPPQPPALAHRTWTKRQATGPPPGLSGLCQPPQKQHRAQPPWQRAQQQHAPQPAPPNTHRAPVAAAAPTPVNATSKPPLHPRPMARPLAARRPPGAAAAAARKKPSVVCGVCDVRCMSVFHLKQHEKGRKHRNKVAYAAGEMYVQCEVCNVHLSGELNVLQHYSGKQHLRRLFLHGARGGARGNPTT